MGGYVAYGQVEAIYCDCDCTTQGRNSRGTGATAGGGGACLSLPDRQKRVHRVQSDRRVVRVKVKVRGSGVRGEVAIDQME
jgi:hypothetical protein